MTVMNGSSTASFMNSRIPEEQEAEQKHKKRIKEDAEVLEMKLMSEIEKAIRNVFLQVDSEVIEKVDADYITNEVYDYLRGMQ